MCKGDSELSPKHTISFVDINTDSPSIWSHGRPFERACGHPIGRAQPPHTPPQLVETNDPLHATSMDTCIHARPIGRPHARPIGRPHADPNGRPHARPIGWDNVG